MSSAMSESESVFNAAPASDIIATIQNFRYNRLITYSTIILTDLFALTVSGVFALGARTLYPTPFILADYVWFLSALPLFLVIFGFSGLYPGVAMNPVSELRRIVHATTFGYLAVIAFTFLAKAWAEYSRLVIAGAWITSVFLVAIARNVVRSQLARNDWWGIPIVIFGAGNTGTLLLNVLLRHPEYGFKPVIVLDDDEAKHRPGDGKRPPVLGCLDLAPWVAKRFKVNYALVAMPSVPSQKLSHILHKHAHQFPHFLLIPDLFGLSLWVTAKDFGGVLGLEIQQNLIRRVPQITKRTIDLILVTLGGICLLPLIIVLYLSVALTSKGPVFYSQVRAGRYGKDFRMWKFRSMIPNAEQVLQEYLAANPEIRKEWELNHKLRNDPRVTKVGKLLRKTSLDELPQLWNVFSGEMSLVGPRPRPKYEPCADLYMRVRPGITGLWQVSGRNTTTKEARFDFDEYYVRNWSIWLDLYILGRTIKTVIRTEGAY